MLDFTDKQLLEQLALKMLEKSVADGLYLLARNGKVTIKLQHDRVQDIDAD